MQNVPVFLCFVKLNLALSAHVDINFVLVDLENDSYPRGRSAGGVVTAF